MAELPTWMLSLRRDHVYYFTRRQFVTRCHNWLLKYVDNENRVWLINTGVGWGGVYQEVSISCVPFVVCCVDSSFVAGRHPSDFHDRVTVSLLQLRNSIPRK